MKKEKVNIICLYWIGEFRERNFTINHIDKLYNSVSKHIDRPFDFYVLTNDFGDGIRKRYNVIPLKYGWPGWWSKIELHRPDLPKGRTLYMDLDSHAVRSLQPILDFPGDLVMFDTRIDPGKWDRLKRHKWVCRYQAATMLFDSGTKVMQNVWNKFIQQPGIWMKKYRSDQDVMGDWIPNQPTFPKQWMCKLATVELLGKIPDDVIIVTGQPSSGLFHKIEQKLPWFEEIART